MHYTQLQHLLLVQRPCTLIQLDAAGSAYARTSIYYLVFSVFLSALHSTQWHAICCYCRHFVAVPAYASALFLLSWGCFVCLRSRLSPAGNVWRPVSSFVVRRQRRQRRSSFVVRRSSFVAIAQCFVWRHFCARNQTQNPNSKSQTQSAPRK